MSDANPTTFDFSVVRELRKRAGYTLGEVSQQSGISIAVLSKLERNQNAIELDTLFRLARVFGQSASDLLSLAESTTASFRKVERYRSGFFTFEKIHFTGIDSFVAKASQGEVLSRPEAHGDEFEICWVRSGRLRIELPLEHHNLGPGEALKFDALLPHTYEILEDAELIIIHLKKTHRF